MIFTTSENSVRKRAKGAGRKPIGLKTLDVKVNIRANAEERQFFKKLGGSRWMRRTLLIAKVPADCFTQSIKGMGVTTNIQVRLSPELATKFYALGGSCWLHNELRKNAGLSAIEPTLHAIASII